MRHPVTPNRKRWRSQQLDTILNAIQQLDQPDTLNHIQRIEQAGTTAIDGWKPSLRPAQTPGGTPELTAVEHMADQDGFAGTIVETRRLADGTISHVRVRGVPPDPTGESVRLLTDALRRMAADARIVNRQREYLLAVRMSAPEDTAQERRPQGMCLACGRPVAGTAVDRLRAGYCLACWRAWDRAGRPDRHYFELGRSKWSPTTPDTEWDDSRHHSTAISGDKTP